MKTLEYKVIIFVTGLLLALAWSWLPWLGYNGIVLVTGILPPTGIFGYTLITIACWGGFAAIVEHNNPRVYEYD